jgi:hypothetical protein
MIGEAAVATYETHVAQVFIKGNLRKDLFEQKLGKVRELAEHQIHESKLKHRQAFAMGTLSAQVIREAS